MMLELTIKRFETIFKSFSIKLKRRENEKKEKEKKKMEIKRKTTLGRWDDYFACNSFLCSLTLNGCFAQVISFFL
jgi:hypothetical protein